MLPILSGRGVVYAISTIINTSPLPNSGGGDPTSHLIAKVLSIVFAVTTSLALLIIVISGFRYITAQGDPNAVAQARNSILYAVIGLLVSFAAFSIVGFALNGLQ